MSADGAAARNGSERADDEQQEAGGTTPREGWRLLSRMTGRNRRLVALGVLAGQLWTVLRVAIPLLTAGAINLVQGLAQSNRHQPDHHHLSELAWWGVAILLLGGLSATCSGIRRYLAFAVAYRVETDLREDMFGNLQRLDFRFHDHAQTGQLMARAATDLQQINQFVVMIPITIANILTILSVTAILFYINATLALIALASLPILNLAAKRYSNRIHPVSMTLQHELSGLSTVVEETVTGIRAVKGFGAESTQARQLAVQADRIYDRIIDLARIRAFFNPLLDVLPALSLAFVLWYGGVAVAHHRLSLGDLVAFNLYVVMLVGPLQMVGQIIAQAQRAVASSQRVKEILDADPKIYDDPHARPLPDGQGEVRFEQVSFSYGEGGRPVLDGLDLVIRPGESVALVGATGSGKSTVARLLARFYDPESGRVTLDGADIRDVQLRRLRRAVAIVFEDTFLFSTSVAENIAFAEPDTPFERVVRAAELAGAHEFISDLPGGYDTMLGERGLSLSGGQRQRLALARAILADPRVLVLDDATSSVDATKEHEIRDALTQVMTGRTTIVIAHRPATIALAQRVVLVDGGRIVAEGTHESLAAGNDRYREVLAQGAAIDVARAHLAGAEEVPA
ncbi:MAG TPA: ABC transporter ATP-binding protein [Acidimicrobiales bacterium]|nr:ABC transporter ATP-binding protein [Acidimicrobiales bacterium]